MKSLQKHDKGSFVFGIIVSSVGHFALAFFLLFFFQAKSKETPKPREIYSVTLEGGQALGGVDLVPLDPNFKKKVVPNFKRIKGGIEAPEVEKSNKAIDPTPRKLDGPSVVDDPEYFKKLEADKKRALEEKRRQELEKKKKAEAERKRQEELKRKKAEEARKKKEAEKKRKEEQARKKELEEKRKAEAAAKKKKDAALAAKQAEAKLNERLNRAKEAAMQRYEGESVNAGGEGIGAAKLGGQGSGGGNIVSIEKRRYDILLEQHVHGGWRWLSGRDQLEASVEVRVMSSGAISNAYVVASSGNSNFDEAVLRAVYKASPLPKPPASLYNEYYKVVVFTFRSNE